MSSVASSELTLNKNGKLYHLNVGPEDLAKTIVLVGDPGRVQYVGSFFDSIRFQVENREFSTLTGTYKGKALTVVSTGIGTDNVDIVLNELDAAVNFDLQTREEKLEKTSFDIVRIGTCGALQEDIVPGTRICSKYAVGIDGLAHFYAIDFKADEKQITADFVKATHWTPLLNRPYTIKAADHLMKLVAPDMEKGITTTASGFYGPQGRKLRLDLSLPDFKEGLRTLSFEGVRATNLEMETSGLYALSRGLGHSAVTVCLVLANRYSGEFLPSYKEKMGELIETVLDRLATH